MKIKLEMDIPDDVLKPGMSSHDQKKAIEAYLGREVQSVEANLPDTWQVWSRVGNDWRVLDLQDDGGMNTLDAVRDDEFYYNHVADNVCGDERAVSDRWFTVLLDDTVIRHAGMRHVDPMIMQVVTPIGNLASVDIAKFLMSEDGDKIEDLAARGFEMNASDVGAVIDQMMRWEGFIFEQILDKGDYLDGVHEFKFEIAHERWSPQSWCEAQVGSVSVDAKALEVWLRENRNDLQYPDSPIAAP